MVRMAAMRTQTANGLKQMVIATHNACSANSNRLPPATGIYGGINATPASLSVHLLPYIEQKGLYEQWMNGTAAATLNTTIIQAFVSPLDTTTLDRIRVQNYASNLRVFTDGG